MHIVPGIYYTDAKLTSYNILYLLYHHEASWTDVTDLGGIKWDDKAARGIRRPTQQIFKKSMPIIISDYRGTCVRICVFLGAYGGDKRSYCKFIIRVLDDLFFSEPDPITIICQNNEPDAIMISFFSTLQKMSHDQIMI